MFHQPFITYGLPFQKRAGLFTLRHWCLTRGIRVSRTQNVPFGRMSEVIHSSILFILFGSGLVWVGYSKKHFAPSGPWLYYVDSRLLQDSALSRPGPYRKTPRRTPDSASPAAIVFPRKAQPPGTRRFAEGGLPGVPSSGLGRAFRIASPGRHAGIAWGARRKKRAEKRSPLISELQTKRSEE